MPADQEYNRQYYAANKERINARNRAWRNANLEKTRAIKKRWELKNKDKVRKYREDRLATLSGFLSRKISHLKKAKRSRKLIVDIDAEFLVSLWELQQGKCAISHFPMRYPETGLFSVSIDRIDPKKDYTKDNVQLVCQGINFAKNKYSNAEMIEFWNYRLKIQQEITDEIPQI